MGRCVTGLAVALVLAACSAGAGSTGTSGDVIAGASTSVAPASPEVSSDTTAAGDTTITTQTTLPDPTTGAEPGEGCPAFEGEPFRTDAVVDAEPVPGSDLAMRAALYPHPDYEGNPWSEWGQGIVTPDGRYYSAIGDHLGAEGNSYLYEFDPQSGTLTQIADVASLVGDAPDDWGHGKIHAQMVAGPCGEIYAATYWGTRRGIESVDYSGGLLLRIDPASRTVANLGAPVPGHGIPSMASWPEGGLIYGEAADPYQPTGTNSGPFFVYDVSVGEVIFSDADPTHDGFRSIAVGSDGRAYVTFGEGTLAVYDPQVNEFVDTVSIPGGRLRAATAPASDGTIYAASDRPDAFFAVAADGTVSELGVPEGYTASMALDERRGMVYSVPGAHGNGYSFGTPLVALDMSSGMQSEVIELAPPIERHLGVQAGGTYGIAIDESADTIFMTLNAGPANSRDTFGEVVLVELALP